MSKSAQESSAQKDGSNGTSGSRRDFLRSVISAPLAAGLGSGLRGAIVLPPGARAHEAEIAKSPGVAGPAAVQFPMPGFIRYDGQCFSVNDRDTFLFGACFHYPRCPRELWSDRLMKLKAAGFNVIETYAFWNYHEPEEGHADLGEFEDFIKLVGSMGFYMIARPGPYVCAEWDSGGFPRWVINRRFPLRSNDPESIRTSQHWFNEVLPVIARHQVTHSGPIILMQIENEYDYWKLPEAEKAAYVRALAHMAWNGGIDIPLITCWTKQVRNRQDPDFSRIMDTCNFYPRWDVVREVIPAIAKLRREQPGTPLGITELQGGWFSEFGGKLPVDQEGVNGRQLELLSKTAIEQGVTYYNYYMGFGGTNFDWAAKTLTTTYDYAAPLREPGGLWEKYYAARGIGLSLKLFGPMLIRSEAAANAAGSTNPQVSVSLRVNGKSGVVFIRENGNANQRYKASFQDPHSPTHRLIATPRQGELELGPREMKMLPVQIPIGDHMLRYTTGEVLGYGESGRPYLVIYDEPGRLVEFSLDTEIEPHVEGDTAYQYWDEEYESWVCGVRMEGSEKMLLYQGHLQVVLMPRERALKSWAVEWPNSLLPGSAALSEEEQKGTFSVPFFSDTAVFAGSGRSKKTVWADLDLAPGNHAVKALVPPLPQKFWLNGTEAEFEYDRHWETCTFSIGTPQLPAASQNLKAARLWVERFDSTQGHWVTFLPAGGGPHIDRVNAPLRPLDDLGALPYGYVKYRSEFNYAGQPRMFIDAFADDGKKVFINGKLVPEASKPLKTADFAPADYAHAGSNTLEISYELFGAPNFGEDIGEMKGIASVRYGESGSSGTSIDRWQLQRFPGSMQGRRLDPSFAPSGTATASAPGQSGIVPAFCWCRAEFGMTAAPEGWWIPWKLSFEAERDALLYLNGRFVGRYVIAGPQTDFYLPETYLVFGERSHNTLTVCLAYTDNPGAIRTLRVAPYEEFATHRTRVEFQW